MTIASSHQVTRERRKRLQLYLDRVGLSDQTTSVVPLMDDASDRRYFRVTPLRKPSLVIAVYEGAINYATLPFVNVAKLLRQMPVPIPNILDHEASLGVLVLEDLGNVTIQEHMQTEPNQDHTTLYRKAVNLIEILQRRGRSLASPIYFPFGLVLDVTKLTWELDFFCEHFLETYRGVVISTDTRRSLHYEFQNLAEELAAEPCALCHRDYHSRNLMLCRNSIYLIDFQDARMGPYTYDLASLLKDSYVELSEQVIEELISYFLKVTHNTVPLTQFRQRFDAVCLQRNLKALGTFGAQATAYQNDRYIKYMPRTLGYIRENLQQHTRFGKLHDLLATSLPELR